jgi:AcrR family transcriptional regulator
VLPRRSSVKAARLEPLVKGGRSDPGQPGPGRGPVRRAVVGGTAAAGRAANRPVAGRRVVGSRVDRGAGPGRPRSLQSEEAILEATGKLLSSEGYLGLTLSKVAARARASKSTIYRRWPTKEHLVMAAFDRWPLMVPRDRGNLLSDLVDLYQQYLRVHYRAPAGAIVPTLAAERVSNPALSALFDSLMQRRLDPTRVIVKRAIERGELPADTDLELAVEAVTAAAVLRVYFLPTDQSVKAIRRLFVVQLRGLRARGY